LRIDIDPLPRGSAARASSFIRLLPAHRTPLKSIANKLCNFGAHGRGALVFGRRAQDFQFWGMLADSAKPESIAVGRQGPGSKWPPRLRWTGPPAGRPPGGLATWQWKTCQLEGVE